MTFPANPSATWRHTRRLGSPAPPKAPRFVEIGMGGTVSFCLPFYIRRS
jgi:hypothetical protein